MFEGKPLSLFEDEEKQEQDEYGFFVPSDTPNPELIYIPRTVMGWYAHYYAAKKDIRYFSKHVLGFKPAWFHEEFWEDLQKHDRLMRMVAREHGKTVMMNFIPAMWNMTFSPGYQIYLYSSNSDMAKELLKRMDELFSLPFFNNELIHGCKLVNRKAKGWNMSELTLGNGSRIKILGIGSATRGPHPDCVICDDILSDKLTIPEEKLNQIFFQALSNMPKKNTGKLIVIGTPQHYQDILHQLMENKRYNAKKYPALNMDTKEVLWSDYWTYEDLMRKKVEIGELNFIKEYLCEPIDDATSLFHYNLISQTYDYLLRLASPKKEGEYIAIGCDLAISDSSDADYTVFTVAAWTKEGNKEKIILKDIFRARGLPHRQQLDELKKLIDFYKPVLVYVENNQFQAMFEQQLRSETAYTTIQGYKTGSEKHRLDVGVPSLRALFENKTLVLPHDPSDPYTINLIKTLTNELMAFSVQQKRVVSVAKHDDMVMSLWLVIQAIRDIEKKQFWWGTLSL